MSGKYFIYIFLISWTTFQIRGEEYTYLDNLLKVYRFIHNTLVDAMKNNARTEKSLQILDKQLHKLQKQLPFNATFPCNVTIGKSKQVPQSVHKLRVGDINVIGAIGDSLVVGFGQLATDLPGVLVKERGNSFLMGGEADWRKFLTVPNLLKEFNPNLIGYSLGPSLSTDKMSQFNVAEGGTISKNMPYMAKVLVKRIKSDKRVDLVNDWKMISIFVGHNDFCTEICFHPDLDELLEKHKNELRSVLRILKQNLPRTLVNVMQPIHVDFLIHAPEKPSYCEFLHHALCPCVAGLKYIDKQPDFYKFIYKWQLAQVEVVSEGEFESEDFTVVEQSFFIHGQLPFKMQHGHKVFDFTYTSADCFHFSQKCAAAVAVNFWNCLLTPVGSKPTFNFTQTEFKCPGPNDFIPTRRNL